MFDPVGALLEDAVEPANTDAVGLFTEFLNDTLLLRTEPPSDGECTSPLLSGESVWAQHTPLGTRLPPPLRADDTLRSPPAVGRIVAVAALERLDRSNKRARGSGTPMGMGSPVSTVQDLAALDEHRCAPAPSPRRLTGSTGSGTSSPASARGSPQPAGVPSRKNRPQRCCKPRRAHQPPAPGEAPRLSACQRRGSAVCKDVGHKSRTCKFGPGKGSSPSCPAPARRGALTRYVILTGDALPADSNDANALDVI